MSWFLPFDVDFHPTTHEVLVKGERRDDYLVRWRNGRWSEIRPRGPHARAGTPGNRQENPVMIGNLLYAARATLAVLLVIAFVYRAPGRRRDRAHRQLREGSDLLMLTCDVCDGAGFVRLPVRSTVTRGCREYVNLSSRTFPCPRCAPRAPSDRVAIIEHHAKVDDHYQVPREYSERTIARLLADTLRAQNLIHFETGKRDPLTDMRPMMGTVALVTKSETTALEAREQRAAERAILSIAAALDSELLHFHPRQLERYDVQQLIQRMARELISRWRFQP